ncbi:hypothetical protein MPTK1_2g16140 [Marchantia polymorpha subsp. ruderalis]|nr:hypothetical protein MARPO_0122s0049 [Marchantia polymorpha]BBN02543.1 hypothetical protein Mp_2g16140 [Marchantia polymorpha subsp. ruderalis]|eukprot:PTQ30625.1 hypothetical protein MARPO_0122s0049 [Marchantia polymorpha]
METFSVAVIGIGLMGSAACRHLSLATGEKVVGIGPAEPEDWKSHAGVFASHYDQGRITRIVDSNNIWSKLAARSIERYGLLERESGIRFHYPVGSIRVSPNYKKDGDTLYLAKEVGRGNGAEAELLPSREALQRRFPFFHFEDGDVGLIEKNGAGYINPREMVRAQLVVAAKQGASIVRETVVDLECSTSGVKIRTDGGKCFLATRVLIAADIYTKWLVPGRGLALKTVSELVVLAEVGSDEEKRLQSMPSLIWRLNGEEPLHSVYACPPVKYPDGKTYLKIGGTWLQGSSGYRDAVLSSKEEISHWFHSDGPREEADHLLKVLKKLMPGLAIESVHSKPCIVTYTAHNYPFIDAVDGKPFQDAQVFVVTGGCGAAAKSADEIGRIAALLMEHRSWVYDLDASNFSAVYQSASSVGEQKYVNIEQPQSTAHTPPCVNKA